MIMIENAHALSCVAAADPGYMASGSEMNDGDHGLGMTMLRWATARLQLTPKPGHGKAMPHGWGRPLADQNK